MWKYNQRGFVWLQSPKGFSHLEAEVDEIPQQHSRAQGKAVQTERGILFGMQLLSLIGKQPQREQQQDTGDPEPAQGHSEGHRVTQSDTEDKGHQHIAPGSHMLIWGGQHRMLSALPCSEQFPGGVEGWGRSPQGGDTAEGWLHRMVMGECSG